MIAFSSMSRSICRWWRDRITENESAATEMMATSISTSTAGG